MLPLALRASICGHHIIQIQHGGRNRKRNLVLLCRECHALVHKGLTFFPLTNASSRDKPIRDRNAVRARNVRARGLSGSPTGVQLQGKENV